MRDLCAMLLVGLSIGCKNPGPCTWERNDGDSYCLNFSDYPLGGDVFSCPPEHLSVSEAKNTEFHDYKDDEEPITCALLGFNTRCPDNVWIAAEQECITEY